MPKMNLREVDALLDEDREEPEHEDLFDEDDYSHFLMEEDEREARYQRELEEQEREYWEALGRANDDFLYSHYDRYDDHSYELD